MNIYGYSGSAVVDLKTLGLLRIRHGGPWPVEEPFFYTIEEGDRLATIAAGYNVTAEAIARANPNMDPNPTMAGQQILIPTGGDKTNDAGGWFTHFVEVGDSLATIAERYHVTIAQLVDANGLAEDASLQVGQELVIPQTSPIDDDSPP